MLLDWETYIQMKDRSLATFLKSKIASGQAGTYRLALRRQPLFGEQKRWAEEVGAKAFFTAGLAEEFPAGATIFAIGRSAKQMIAQLPGGSSAYFTVTLRIKSGSDHQPKIFLHDVVCRELLGVGTLLSEEKS